MAMKCYANGYTARFFANKGYLILHLEHTLFFFGKKIPSLSFENSKKVYLFYTRHILYTCNLIMYYAFI